jgi:hypothetical protein
MIPTAPRRTGRAQYASHLGQRTQLVREVDDPEARDHRMDRLVLNAGETLAIQLSGLHVLQADATGGGSVLKDRG